VSDEPVFSFRDIIDSLAPRERALAMTLSIPFAPPKLKGRAYDVAAWRANEARVIAEVV
jgi:hypothetical protein